MRQNLFTTGLGIMMVFLISCSKSSDNELELPPPEIVRPVLLVIDEESIDNDTPPNNFSDVAVNDPFADVGFRTPLRFFRDNPGRTITLYTGEVGDEGWYALKTIPAAWKNAGAGTGAENFINAAPGLGSGNDPEALLDKIPDVTPLRGAGLKMLVGKTIYALVYDSDISMNYSPINGSLKGATLGTVAFKVISIAERTNGSDAFLPIMTIEILDTEAVLEKGLFLFSNPPPIQSSSEPFNTAPPETVGEAILIPAP